MQLIAGAAASDSGFFVLVGWLVGRFGPHDGIVRLDDGLAQIDEHEL